MNKELNDTQATLANIEHSIRRAPGVTEFVIGPELNLMKHLRLASAETTTRHALPTTQIWMDTTHAKKTVFSIITTFNLCAPDKAELAVDKAFR